MSDQNEWFDTTFAGQPVMAILRGFSVEQTVELAGRAWDLGLDCVEVPIQTPDAVPSLAAAVAAGRERGREVGAGTVVTIEQLDAAAEHGATFTVAPGLDAEIVTASAERGLPHLPGVSTPSEIQQAMRMGLRWLKAFPATVLGTGWFTAMAGPFPGVSFVATGGITAHNAAEFHKAGAKVVAVGSALSDPAQLDLLSELLGG